MELKKNSLLDKSATVTQRVGHESSVLLPDVSSAPKGTMAVRITDNTPATAPTSVVGFWEGLKISRNSLQND